ncbi:hypothetical protein INR49_014466 [Caranx melampygus]|nr:hypothetical protein INR49_014466 [Caranx melampygus]
MNPSNADHRRVSVENNQQINISADSTARQQARTCRREVSKEDDNRRIKDGKGGMRKRLKRKK